MKLNKRKMYLVAILLFIVASIISIGKYLDKKDNLYMHTFRADEFTLIGGEFDENGVLHINTENAQEGIVASLYIPGLEKSGYNIVLTYNSSSDGSYIYSENKEIAEVLFEPYKQNLHKGANHIFDSFFLDADSDGTVMHVYYDGTGEISIENFDLEQNSNVYRQNIIKAMIFGAICLLLVYLYYAEAKQRKIVLGLLFISTVASNLLYMNYLVGGHDLSFHLNRIEGIFVGLQNGEFPVKIQTPWLNGYGYPVGVFYGDILLYFPAVLRLFGFSIQGSYQVFVFTINIVTTFIAYYSFKRLFDSENMGFAGAAIYTLSLYRLENLYSRAAVGEYCAMVFLPLILVGMKEILTEKKENKRVPAVLLFAVGLSGLIHTHILSCVIVAFFVLLTCLVFIKRVFNPSVFVRLVLVVVLTLMLSLDFIVPFLDYYTLDFKVNSASWGTTYIQNMGLFINQIFALVLNSQGGGFYPSYGIAGEMTVGLGVVPLIGCLLYIYLLLSDDYRKRKSYEYKLGVYSFVLFVLSVLFSTCYFPWDQISHMNTLFETIIGIIQFPWRFLGIAILFSTVFICIALKELRKTLPIGQQGVPVVLICLLIGLTVGNYCNSFMINVEYGQPVKFYERNSLNFNQIYTGEYLPEGTDPELLIDGKIVTTENVKYENYSKIGSNVTCYVLSEGSNGYIEFPLLYYKGYSVVGNSIMGNIDVLKGDNNLVRVILPNDYVGEIKVSFEEPIYWRVAELITVLSFAGVLVYWMIFGIFDSRIRKNERCFEKK